MKIVKLEVLGFDDAARRKALYEMCQTVRVATNCLWRNWLVWHTAVGTAETLLAELAADRAWREADKKTRGARPTPTTNAWHPALASLINTAIADRCPTLHCRCRTLLIQSTRGKLVSRKSNKGNIKGWKAILLDIDQAPSCTRPQPIPFDRANSALSLIDESKDLLLTVRVDRYLDESGRGKSEPWEFRLKAGGKVERYAQPMRDVAAGRGEFAGSSLWYDAAHKKWFALLAYQEPAEEKAAVDPDRVLYVRFGARDGLRARCDGRSLSVLRDVDFVGHRRTRLLRGRLGRQHNYRWATRSAKGHGRDRALGSAFKLAQAWKMFTKTVNESLAVQVLRLAVKHGAAKIVILGTRRGDRAVETAGKLPGFDDSTGWPFFQFASLLAMKAGRKSISVESRGAQEKAAAGVTGDAVQ